MYNSGASASIFQVEHVNYENASERSVVRGSRSMRRTVVGHPSLLLVLENSCSSQLASQWLAHGTNGSSYGGRSFHREEISSCTELKHQDLTAVWS